MRTASKYAIAVLLLLLVALVVWIFVFGEAIAAAIGSLLTGAAGLAAVYGIVSLLFPDLLKTVIATILRALGHLPKFLQRVTVANEVEVSLKKAVSQIGHESGSVIPYPPKVVWVSSSNFTAESFFREGRIVIKLEYSDNPHRNIVETAILYCRSGLLRTIRQHLDSSLVRAVDLMYVRALLDRQRMTDARMYFNETALPREFTRFEGCEPVFNELNSIDQAGYFTRMFLPEAREYEAHCDPDIPGSEHEQHIVRLLGFINGLNWPPPVVLVHLDTGIRIAVMIVGNPDKLRREGLLPYIRRIVKDAYEGANVVYVIGHSQFAGQAVPAVVSEAQRLGLCGTTDVRNYQVVVGGRVERRWFARMVLSPTTGELWDQFESLPDLPNWTPIVEPA